MTRLAVAELEDRCTPAIVFAAGSAPGVEATVWLTIDRPPVDAATAIPLIPPTLNPFPGFSGGVRVAMGDVTGDGTPDVIAAAGPGAGPQIAVYDGTDARLIGSFYAFDPSFTGGVSVASADVDSDGVADIVAGAGAGGGPHVKVFSGQSGDVIRSFFAFDANFTGGVQVGSADANHDGYADILVGAGAGGGPRVSLFDGDTGEVLQNFFAFESTFTGGVSVALADLAGDRELDIVVGAGPGGGPHVRTFFADGSERSSFFAFDDDFQGGVYVGSADLDGNRLDDLIVGGAEVRGYEGSSLTQTFESDHAGVGASVAGALSTANGGTGAEDSPDFPDIPVLERLALFDPSTGIFGTVAAGSIPAGKNVYVMSHGWAPGYKSWVDSYFAATGEILKSWQTDPNDPDYAETNKYNVDGLPAAGAFQFSGMPPPPNPDNVVVSPSGLAAIISAMDPNAVVLAFSWLDESATAGIISGIDTLTGDVNVSEAHTTQNGLRLAQAVEQAVGTGYTGRLHLLGHSHGSKVVSVAATELAANGLTPAQVSTFDSPEDDLTQRFEAANFNWYFLQNLNVSRDPLGSGGGTFVDNYISYFGERYSNVGPAGSPLANIVDVNLDPSVIYPVSILHPTLISQNIGASHSYAATWYAGTTNAGGDGGLAFSPLVNPVPGTPWDALYNQIWGTDSYDQQFVLQTGETFPPATTVTPTFTTISFDSAKTTGNVSVSGGSVPTVTLNDSNGTATWAGKFDPATRATGIAFDYQFATPGETLTIAIDGELVFVMEGSVAGTAARTATLSTGVLKPVFFFDDVLTLSLSSTSNAAASVTLSNFRLLTV